MFLLAAVASLAVLRVTRGGEESPALSGQRLRAPLLVMQLPANAGLAANESPERRPVRSFAADGGRIVLVHPNGSVRVLTRDFHSACEPDVSFDGQRFLFAGKRSPRDAWNVYEMRIDGSAARRITRDLGDCRAPGYQSRHYQITESNDTWFQITFVRSGRDERNERGSGPASRLWSCKLDGSLARPISFNLSNDFDPTLMWDGRLLHASWRAADGERGHGDRVSLLDINTDGTDYAPFVVAAGKRIKHMPCTTAQRLAVFVEADELRWDGSGALGSVSLLRPLHTYQSLTRESDGLYHSPSPLPDGGLLVSRRPADGSAGHAVYRFDLSSKKTTLVFDDPERHDVQARIVVPRDEPDGRSSPVIDTDPLGKLYCLSVYNADLPSFAALPRGAVKRLRVVEGLPRVASSTAGDAPGSSAEPTMRRVLGECDVPDDGSFNVQVPANIPLELQLLDERGLTIRRCGWVWTRNHFNQGCVGCHEDPELTPENQVVSALTQPSVVLNAPPEQRRTVTFVKDIAPLIAAKCAPCHAENGAPPTIPSATVAAGRALYAAVRGAEASTASRGGTYVQPGQARTSRLIWHVLGANASRPWDGASAATAWKPIPPDGPVRLTAAEQTLLIQWIDLGASFAGPADVPPPAETTSRSP